MKKLIFISAIVVFLILGLVYIGRIYYFLNYKKFNPGIDINQLNTVQKNAVDECKKKNDIVMAVEELPSDVGEYDIRLNHPDMFNDFSFIGLGMVPIRYNVISCYTYTDEQINKRELIKSKISAVLNGLYSQTDTIKGFISYLDICNYYYSDKELKQLYQYHEGVPYLKVLLKVHDVNKLKDSNYLIIEEISNNTNLKNGAYDKMFYDAIGFLSLKRIEEVALDNNIIFIQIYGLPEKFYPL